MLEVKGNITGTVKVPRSTVVAHLLSNSVLGIHCDDDGMAFLSIDDKVFLFFKEDADVLEFVSLVSELEISNDAFKSERKDEDYENNP